MPPTSNVRKTSAATTNVTHVNDPNAPTRRTTSGRAVRQNTTRPSNYYARPFGSFSAAAGANNADLDTQDDASPGFFPALTYFTDAVTALPKEVMRQFTLMKEVEAKIHGPNERLGELVDALMEYLVPPRVSRQQAGGGEVGEGQGILSLTANNSVTGSTAPSLVNGVAPNAHQHSAQNSVSGSLSGEEVMQVGSDEDLEKRRKFLELRMLAPKLLVNLDEKNVVLAEANRIMAQQNMRIDSVMPHVNDELHDEARLGSMTHWAYSENRQKKQMPGTTVSRRDVAATNSLAAAASAIHESDIAQARRDAVRENVREKHKGRAKEHIDSDFDDKPKKTHAKVAKSKAAAGQAGSPGLGISANGEPIKKRKVDKGLGVPAMDRSMSSVTKAAKAAKDTPRSTPNAEPSKKMKAKPGPLPMKRKNVNSSHASPALGASSPLHSSFNSASIENTRPQSARLRQNSTATNLRHERVANDESGHRPTSAPGKVNDEKGANGKRKATDDGDEQREAKKTIERPDGQKREDVDTNADEQRALYASRSGSNSGKAGRDSLTGTPRQETFPENNGGMPAMLRTRSTRSMRGGNRDEESSEERQGSQGAIGGGRGHKRQQSNSHLVRQLAPFNRSPDLDRRKFDDMDEALGSGMEWPHGNGGVREEGMFEGRESEQRSPRKRRLSSRRNTGAFGTESSPPATSERGEDEGDTTMQDVEPTEAEDVTASDMDGPASVLASVPDLDPDIEPDPTSLASADEVEIEEDEDSEPGDPDDPNEPKYCYCNRGSYGEMIACDNEQCPREWFHLECTGLVEPPEEEEKWYCKECAPLFSFKKGRGRGKRG